MMMADIASSVIIGSGPAGLTAAIYLGRSGLQPVVVAGDVPGGQLTRTSLVENFPGFSEAINGAELMMNMISQAERCGAKMMFDSVMRIAKNDDGVFDVFLNSGTKIQAKTVLIATGAAHNRLNIPGEAKFSNKGVSWCATCDGALFRGKVVAVIGGGNTAVMEALFLANFAEKIYLVHRREALRADLSEQEKLLQEDKIEVLWNSEALAINGNDMVESIVLLNNKTGEKTTLPVSGVFEAIGTSPASGLVREIVDCDESGYIEASNTETSLLGLFAAGDVVSGSLKQAVCAAGGGAEAACAIERYLGVR